VIRIDSIRKSFGGAFAVRDLSVTVNEGEVFGLVGPNGAGKTTTIKMVTGLLIPDAGEIKIGGHDIVREPIKAKSVLGYIPDKGFFYEKLSVREFMTFIASVYRIEKSVARARTDELLLLFGIGERADELIESLSQGMRQRLLFASALLHDPKALLIDEPFSGLDPLGVRMLKRLLADLGARGKAVLLATHSLHIAEEVCDMVGFIEKGSLTSIVKREEIKAMKGGLEGMFLKMSGEP
jgi:ABC-2 type transport system ATP-binding protein